MSSVLTDIPRVVHPDDVYSGEVHVAGRHLSFTLCMRDVLSWNRCEETEDMRVKGMVISFATIDAGRRWPAVQRWILHVCRRKIRKNINSVGIMWEMIEAFFFPWNSNCNEWKWKSTVWKFQIDMVFHTAAFLGGNNGLDLCLATLTSSLLQVFDWKTWQTYTPTPIELLTLEPHSIRWSKRKSCR